jgi:hypothetical protein
MSYGTNLAEVFYPSGDYIGRLLNGERPADLPVQQASKVELIINLKTAKLLGLTVPPSLIRPRRRVDRMRRATSVIGPSRHFAAKQRFGRFRREADIKWQAGPTGKVANDPELTWAGSKFLCAGDVLHSRLARL